MAAWYHAGLRRAAHPQVALLATLLTACAASGSAAYYPGASNAARGGGMGPAAATSARPAPRWALFDKARSWPPIGDAPLSARDHGDYLGSVRVSPNARAAYLELARGKALPVGSIIAMFQRAARGDAPGPVYVMQKKAAGWQYLVLGPRGRIRDQGQLPLCERCHAEATADHLFGPPTDDGNSQKARP